MYIETHNIAGLIVRPIEWVSVWKKCIQVTVLANTFVKYMKNVLGRNENFLINNSNMWYRQ